MSSMERMAVMCCVMSRRLRPAYASRVAWHAPSFSLRKRVCTLPRKFSTFRWGYLARICAWRRREAEPTVEPAGQGKDMSRVSVVAEWIAGYIMPGVCG